MSLPANIRVNIGAPFPATVKGSGVVVISKANGIWTVGLNFAKLLPALQTIADPPNTDVLVYNAVTGVYSLVPASAVANLALNNLTITPQVRATLTTGVAVTTADVAGATTIYATPCNGDLVPIYDGVSAFSLFALAADLVLALDNNAGHAGYHQAGKNYFLGIYRDAGTLRLGTGPAWASDTSPGVGAGTAQVSLLNGVMVNTVAITARFGSAAGNTTAVSANCFTVIGFFRPSADGQATDSALKRLLYNFYNNAQRNGLVQEVTASWAYSTAAYQQVNASVANQIEILIGDGVLLEADAFNVVSNSTATARTVAGGIGIDSTTVNSGRSDLLQALTSPIATARCTYRGYPGLGWHKITWLERGNGTDTQTWFGNNAGASVHRSGLQLAYLG
jgi:hypothetical protein